MTSGEAAKLLGVAQDTLVRWHRAGKVAASVTLGGWRNFSAEEVARVKELLEEKRMPRKA